MDFFSMRNALLFVPYLRCNFFSVRTFIAQCFFLFVSHNVFVINDCKYAIMIWVNFSLRNENRSHCEHYLNISENKAWKNFFFINCSLYCDSNSYTVSHVKTFFFRFNDISLFAWVYYLFVHTWSVSNFTSFFTNKSLMYILSGLGGTRLCRRTALSAVGWQPIKWFTSEL